MKIRPAPPIDLAKLPVPTGPAPGAPPPPPPPPSGAIDGLTAADRVSLAFRERDLAASVRLRCLEIAERLDPFGSVRRRLAERTSGGDDQTAPAVEQTIALARRLEAYVLGQEEPQPMERYCVDSGRPVSMISGDRCRAHGDAYTPCQTDIRPAQCQHPHLSPNHPTPHCSECGRDVTP